jgi:NAD(P)-dependent dehydrogenase (short-subunit alcohol dehydrogenase family)
MKNQTLEGSLRGSLQGKTALITGGNSGMGLATALAFAEAGARVAIAGRDPKTLEEARKQLPAGSLAAVADVSKLADLDALVAQVEQHFGALDILFANAGLAKFGPSVEVSESEFDQQLDVNLKGAFFTLQKSLRLMGKGGSVILNASVVASKGMAGTAAYTASKGGVVSMTRALAAELAPQGIRVNVISPGPIDTPIYGRLGLPADARDGFAKSIEAQTPLGRFGNSSEIATAALFLASDASSFMTGSELVVDGGISAV